MNWTCWHQHAQFTDLLRDKKTDDLRKLAYIIHFIALPPMDFHIRIYRCDVATIASNLPPHIIKLPE